MSKSFKYNGDLDAAVGAYEDLPWSADGDGNVSILNSKTGEYVPVSKGQYIISIADRYEVKDEPPKNAHPVE